MRKHFQLSMMNYHFEITMNVFKLSNIVESYVSGDWGNESYSDDTNLKVFCVRGADIIPILNSDFSKIPVRYISQKSYTNRVLKAGDIVIEKSGGSPTQSTGRAVIITEKLIQEKGAIVCSNFCVAIRIKQGWYSKYVFYLWQHLYNSNIFFNFEGKTSGIKNLQLDNALQAISIERRTLLGQMQIANAIEIYDRKIALNLEINRNLEAMARQLYDYWFVQFDFPDENGRPYKSSGGKMVWNERLKREIPKGWNTVVIGDILDKYPTTKRYETKEYLPQGNYPIIDQGDSYIVGFTNERENLLVRHPAVLFGDHSTKVKFLNFDFARGADGTQILYSSIPEVSQYYLYLALKSMSIPNPGYSRHFKYLKEMPIIVPSTDVAKAFSEIATPLYKQWTNNVFGNIEFTKLRNELLPLLMNGQVNCDLYFIDAIRI